MNLRYTMQNRYIVFMGNMYWLHVCYESYTEEAPWCFDCESSSRTDAQIFPAGVKLVNVTGRHVICYVSNLCLNFSVTVKY